jgi:hypothetical protein
MTAGECAFLVSVFLFFGAVMSRIGFHKIGIGSALGLGLFFVFIAIEDLRREESIEFQGDGLRIEMRGMAFLIRWDLIHEVEVVGPASHQTVVIPVGDVDAVVNSVDPASFDTRMRVRTVLSAGRGLVLTPWCGGLDGSTLIRFLAKAREHSI